MTKRITLIIFFFLITIPLAAMEGTISYFAGVVTVERRGNTLAGEIDMAVQEGDRVTTGANTTAIITLENNVDIKLRAETTLDMDNLSDEVSVKLVKGSIFSRVKRRFVKSYTVKAETVLAGVRGTEFFVAYGREIEDTPDIWLCVNEGSVAVAVEGQRRSTIVKEGEGINIVGGNKLTKPKKYPWTKDLNWNTDPGSGDVKDTTNLDSAYSDLLDQDYD
jgi:ferric-dicitrate binding protein FerR (iron transport regulator)